MLQHADVQRAALRRRLLPRRQRARAAADDAPRRRGRRTIRGSCARWRRATWRSSATPSIAPLGRFRNFMSYARRWREEQGSEDSHGRALWALGTVVGRSADPGRHSLAGDAVPRRAARGVGASAARARGRSRCSASSEYLRAFEGDRNVQAARTRDRRAAARTLPPHRSAGLAVVREPRHVLQRAAAAGADRHRRRGLDDEAMTADRPALARMADDDPAHGGRLLRADRHERLLRARR